MSAASKRSLIQRLISASQHTACPCHGCRAGGSHTGVVNQLRKYASPVALPQSDYAFEVGPLSCQGLSLSQFLISEQVAGSNLRFGDGVTMEVGMDLANMKPRKVCRPYKNI